MNNLPISVLDSRAADLRVMSEKYREDARKLNNKSAMLILAATGVIGIILFLFFRFFYF